MGEQKPRVVELDPNIPTDIANGLWVYRNGFMFRVDGPIADATGQLHDCEHHIYVNNKLVHSMWDMGNAWVQLKLEVEAFNRNNKE